jgi:hypothetical protein
MPAGRGRGLIHRLVKQSQQNTNQISGKFRDLDGMKKKNKSVNEVLALLNKYKQSGNKY